MLFKKLNTVLLSSLLSFPLVSFSQDILEQPPIDNPLPNPNIGKNDDTNQFNSFLFSPITSLDNIKLTQLKIQNLDSLKNSGITQTELLNFVYQYVSFSKNFFFKYPTNSAKLVFAVEIKPFLENAYIKMKEKNLNPEDKNTLNSFCLDYPTHCSLTSVKIIQNNKLKPTIISSFENSVNSKEIELFWKNFAFDEPVRFFFEISLPN